MKQFIPLTLMPKFFILCTSLHFCVVWTHLLYLGNGFIKEEASTSLTVEAIPTLLEEHRKALATEFKISFTLLDVKLDQTRLAVEEHGLVVLSLELAADDLSQRVTKVKVLNSVFVSEHIMADDYLCLQKQITFCYHLCFLFPSRTELYPILF